MQRNTFLRRLLGGILVGSIPLELREQFRKIYLLQFFVAGFRFHEGPKLLNEMKEGDLLSLVREPENQYDNCAIALYWREKKIGFIPAETNEMLSYLLDAEALSLFGTITHLEKNAQPWENLSVAIYFLQETNKELPAHANYLTRVEAPHYKTLQQKKKQVENNGEDDEELYQQLFETYNRVIDISKIKPQHKDAIESLSKLKKVAINKEGNYVLVDTDEIYSYLYDITPDTNTVKDINGEEYIEFFLD